MLRLCHHQSFCHFFHWFKENSEKWARMYFVSMPRRKDKWSLPELLNFCLNVIERIIYQCRRNFQRLVGTSPSVPINFNHGGHCVLKRGFMRTFPGNLDATLKSMSELTFMRFCEFMKYLIDPKSKNTRKKLKPPKVGKGCLKHSFFLWFKPKIYKGRIDRDSYYTM